MDTVGSLIDKLFTVDTKMWHNQEVFYQIRHHDFEWFKNRFLVTEKLQSELFGILTKVSDLNLQRQQLIKEIDSRIVEIIEAGVAGKNLSISGFVVDQHKTY